MKKYVLTTLATVAMASAASFVSAADNFSGGYAGVTAGFSSLKGTGSLFSTASADDSQDVNYPSVGGITGTFGQTGFNGGLLLGYGVLMDAFYVGGELSAIFNSNSDGTPWTLTSKGTAVSGSALTTFTAAQYIEETRSIDFKQKESFGFALRFGYLATQKALVYLSLGLNYSRFSLTENLVASSSAYTITSTDISGLTSATLSQSATPSNSPLGTTKSARALSFTPGIGTEILLSNNLAFRTDFTYELGKAIFGSYDTTPIPNGIKAARSSFRVGLSYHF